MKAIIGLLCFVLQLSLVQVQGETSEHSLPTSGDQAIQPLSRIYTINNYSGRAISLDGQTVTNTFTINGDNIMRRIEEQLRSRCEIVRRSTYEYEIRSCN